MQPELTAEIRFWRHQHGGYRIKMWSLGRTGLRTFAIGTFKGEEKIVNSGKMGVKPGQDVKKIKIKDNPSFFPMSI